MRAGGAEALVVGAHDGVAGGDPGLELGIDVGDVVGLRAAGGGAGRGAGSASPVVPWAYETTGQPPFGGSPFGTLTMPETAVVLPCGVFDV